MSVPEDMANLLPKDELVMTSLGPVTEEDAPEIKNRVRGQSNGLQKVRAVHHQAARMLAAGARPAEVARTTGMHPNRLYILQDDPAFAGLVEHYAEQEHQIWVDARQRAAMLGVTAMEELQDRVLENPENLTNKQLLEIAQAALSHGGYPSTQRVEESKSVDISDIKARAQEQGVYVGGNVERKPVEGRVVESSEASGEAYEPEEGPGSEVREESSEDSGGPVLDVRPLDEGSERE